MYHQALRVSMEEQRARQEKDAREAVTASVTESTNLSTGEKGNSGKLLLVLSFLLLLQFLVCALHCRLH